MFDVLDWPNGRYRLSCLHAGQPFSRSLWPREILNSVFNKAAINREKRGLGAAVIFFTGEVLGRFREGPQGKRAGFFLIGIKSEMLFPGLRRHEDGSNLQGGQDAMQGTVGRAKFKRARNTLPGHGSNALDYRKGRRHLRDARGQRCAIDGTARDGQVLRHHTVWYFWKIERDRAGDARIDAANAAHLGGAGVVAARFCLRAAGLVL
jgi:hypothetical protein